MAKNKQLKSIPIFKTEDEERKFWATHDSTDYIDWTKTIANKHDVPYQSLMKVYLAERVKQEFRSA